MSLTESMLGLIIFCVDMDVYLSYVDETKILFVLDQSLDNSNS